MNKLLKKLGKRFRTILVLPIILYQKIISPLFPRSCRYYPSCSEYSKQAIMRHGFIKGGSLAAARIFRCWGLFSGGEDHVPEEWHLHSLSDGYRVFYSGPRLRKSDKEKKSRKENNDE